MPQKRHQLQAFLRKGRASARCLRRARILLAVDEEKIDAEIAEPLGVSLGLIDPVQTPLCS